MFYCHQEGKDKSFLLEKLQDLQNKNPKQNNQKKVCSGNPVTHIDQLSSRDLLSASLPILFQRTGRHSDNHSSGGPSNSNAMVQALLARQQFEEEEEEERPLPPPDLSSSSALAQAMLARQRAEAEDEDLHRAPDRHTTPSGALALAMQARQAAMDQERDEHYTSGDFYENPGTILSAFEQAMQARRRIEEEGADDADDFPSPMSGVMMQVMQARQRAEEPYQHPAPGASSALIQAMLARQQAQNEFDDGYWTLYLSGIRRRTSHNSTDFYKMLELCLWKKKTDKISDELDELESVKSPEIQWFFFSNIALHLVGLNVQMNQVLTQILQQP